MNTLSGSNIAHLKELDFSLSLMEDACTLLVMGATCELSLEVAKTLLASHKAARSTLRAAISDLQRQEAGPGLDTPT